MGSLGDAVPVVPLVPSREKCDTPETKIEKCCQTCAIQTYSHPSLSGAPSLSVSERFPGRERRHS